MRAYLASPLGFAQSTLPFMELMERVLAEQGLEVSNPWRQPLSAALSQAHTITDPVERLQELRRLNFLVGQANEIAILDADLVIAVLDGIDVDSGTASEIGFAYANGKPIFGLRTDFRLSGENEAAKVNLQVAYWIEASKGSIATSLAELCDELKMWLDRASS